MKFKFLLTGITKLIGAIGLFSFNILIARALTLNEAGIFFFAITASNLYALLIKFGMDVYMQKEASKAFQKQEQLVFKELHLKSVKFSFAVFSISSLLILIVTFILSKQLTLPIFLFGTTAFLIAISWINSGFLKAKGEPVLANLFDYGGTLILASFFVFSISKFNAIDFELITLIYFSSSLACMIIGAYYVQKQNLTPPLNLLKKTKKNQVCFFKKHIKGMSNVLLSQFFAYGMLWSSSFILEYFHSNEEIAKYNILFRTALAISFLLSITNSVFLPKISEHINKKQLSELKELHIRISKQLTLATLPLFFFITIFAQQLLGLYGKAYEELTIPLLIIAFSQLINTITGPVNLILILNNKSLLVRNRYFISMILSISLSLILIPHFKTLGAIISVSIALIFQNTSLTHYAFKKIY